MKQSILRNTKSWFLTVILAAMQFIAVAQEKVESTTVTKANVSNWFERNWMWVTGVAVVLLLIIIFSGSSTRSRSTTTVVKDDFGNVRSVNRTETVD